MNHNRCIWRITALLVFSLFILAGCTSSPGQLKDWYAENYPSPTSLSQNEQQKSSRPILSAEAGSQDDTVKSQTTAAFRVSHQSASETEKNELGTISGSLTIVRGSLEDPVDLKFAAEDPKLSKYNVSSLIEGKLFKLVEDAYIKRDENEFMRLYQFFLDSFPQSGRKNYLQEKRRTFFYSEDLDAAPLKDGLVEVSYPLASNLDEFSHYLAKLKSNGIGSIQLNMVQVLEQPIYLFAKPENPLGYYFKTPVGPLVDNLLDQITAVAHDNGLRVLISFPLRNHPMLGHQSTLLVDESWNAIQNRTTPNAKLDLLNPESQTYLIRLIQSLLDSQIDGIVFKDDFTYEINEGFSAAARQRYLEMTGRIISFNSLFVPVKSSGSSRFEILTDEAFDHIAVWRSREVKQLLWDLIANIRKQKESFIVGMEVTPEMVLQESLSVKWYSTGLSYLKDLDLDLFVLNWRKSGSDAQSDVDNYRKSAWQLRDSILPKTSIYMKVPLSPETNNMIRLNRRIQENVKVQQGMSLTKMAVGPVSRLKQLDFLYESK